MVKFNPSHKNWDKTCRDDEIVLNKRPVTSDSNMESGGNMEGKIMYKV